MSKKIAVGVDIRDLRIASTGTRTYLEEVCTHFREMQGSEFQFYFFDTLLPVYRGSSKILKLIEHLRFFVWKQLILPVIAWSKGCKVLFCTDNIVPFLHLGYRPVPVLHDAFFFENPEHYNRIWLWAFKKALLAGARRAPYIVTPSEYAKQQIHLHTGLDKNKLMVIYEGPKQSLYGKPLTSLPGLENTKFILHVGVLDKRKNLPALIKAFARLKPEHPGLKLVLAGKSLPKDHSDDSATILQVIGQLSLEKDVILTGYLTDTQLAWLYSNALIYVFPSLNEGFGLPVLEAFSFGLPVLVANNSSLPEVGGDAVLTFDPLDTNDMFNTIRSVLDNDSLRQSLIEKGKMRVLNFSWKNTALQLAELFKRTANNS